ncbi:MAG: IS4 family transposase [Chloroflexi bacterium]|nr:IS4 family transposase [Chloroflexota bacterium]
MAKETKITSGKRKPSSVRHTRAIARDRTKRPGTLPPDEQIEQRLTELVHPATLAQVAHFQQQGLRERTLTLPVMLALVLSMIWRQIGAVCELARRIQSESMLWAQPTKVSQQALSQRLTSLPAGLFGEVLTDMLPRLQQRWAARQRPLPEAIRWAGERYTQVAICDGSTLDALIRKLGLLKDLESSPLAGRMTALLDAASRLPLRVWYDEQAQVHDLTFWPQIVGAVRAGALLIFDLGYTHFRHFADLTARQITFLTRAKANLAYQVERVLQASATVHDALVWIGQGADRQQVRLIEVLHRGLWYRYLTNERDAERLPAHLIVALYGQRWRIEDAYAIVKRLLGLAYFWCGSPNAVQLQLWATWTPEACMPSW